MYLLRETRWAGEIFAAAVALFRSLDSLSARILVEVEHTRNFRFSEDAEGVEL